MQKLSRGPRFNTVTERTEQNYKLNTSQVSRTPTTTAENESGINPYRCQLILAHLDIASHLQLCLLRSLSRHNLNDLQFRISRVLQAKGSQPICAAALAECTSVSRSAVTEAVDQLVRKKLATRIRNPKDRRFISVQLTEFGQKTVSEARLQYLKTATFVARHIEIPMIHESLESYTRMKQGISEASLLNTSC